MTGTIEAVSPPSREKSARNGQPMVEGEQAGMPSVSTCLWFARDAEAATAFYVSLLPGSAIDAIQRAPSDWPGGKAGDALMIRFRLGGQSFQALNGGTAEAYSNAASISVQCAGQADIDRLWDALTAHGGTALQCGWLRDRWGVPWQIVPANLSKLLHHADPAIAARVFRAMRGMAKFDIQALIDAAK